LIEHVHAIPIEVIPSHIHLSTADYAVLFGDQTSTVAHRLSQQGQHASDMSVEVRGKLLKRAVVVRYVGPERKETQVELTPTEAKYLGIEAPVARSGELAEAGECTLIGLNGKLQRKAAVIIPRPHLHCSPDEASVLRLSHGQEVSVELHLDVPRMLEGVVVRVHPSYTLRLHIHADIAREHWIAGPTYASLEKTSSVFV
jgi:propanediol utilization protein